MVYYKQIIYRFPKKTPTICRPHIFNIHHKINNKTVQIKPIQIYNIFNEVLSQLPYMDNSKCLNYALHAVLLQNQTGRKIRAILRVRFKPMSTTAFKMRGTDREKYVSNVFGSNHVSASSTCTLCLNSHLQNVLSIIEIRF